ncbi:unnamed protein product [Amoebophrya sp. A25]|nr:unnamed protein product [Amoebophrya sp. A25]|eukprot:GSA25T00008728001.1
MERRRASDLQQPDVGKILTMQALFTEIDLVIFNAKSIWAGRFDGETNFRQRVPGRVEVHCGEESTFVHRAILGDNPSFTFLPLSPVARGATNCNTAEAFCQVPTNHFSTVMFYMKLRFLLRLHSALCELDNNYCSLAGTIQGMHALAVQECERCPSDNQFEVRRKKQTYDPTQVVDDLFEQLERGLGKGYETFMNYVMSCDPRKALMVNKHDVHIARVRYNDRIEVMLEEIFLAYYCDLPAKTHRVSEILSDIEAFSLPVPRIPPLKCNYVTAFMQATSGGTRCKREKGAQFEALHMVANLDLEELGEFESEDSRPAENVTHYRKKKVPMSLFPCIFSIIGHKLIFREGIRERLINVVKMRYDLDEFLLARLDDLGHINLDNRLLTEDQMHRIVMQEKEKLCQWFEDYFQSTLPFLQPSVVGIEREKEPRYWHTTDATDDHHIPRPNYQRTEEDRFFIYTKPPSTATMKNKSKPQFVVPNVNSPLVKDQQTAMLKTTGFFNREEGACI